MERRSAPIARYWSFWGYYIYAGPREGAGQSSTP